MKYVLFVCTHNASRSQMAQAFYERDCAHDSQAESAGRPIGEVREIHALLPTVR